MTDNKIYFISQDIYSEEDSEEFWKNMKIFTNLHPFSFKTPIFQIITINVF